MAFVTGYTKLFGSIVASTIWREDNDTRIVWITMLALANRYGIVEASLPGLADLSRVSVDAARTAISKLEAPDPDSRTKEHAGRRIQPVDGGWLVLNHAAYRQKMRSQERREYLAIKQREHRAKVKAASTCQQLSTTVNQDKPIAEAEAEAEAYKTTLSGKPDCAYHKDSRSVLHILNEASGGRYREVDSNLSLISARLKEPEVDLAGMRLMILRQCRMWKGTKMEKFLRPETLFAKSKFDSYYGTREKPDDKINDRDRSRGPDRNEGTYFDADENKAGIERRIARDRQILEGKMARPGGMAPGNQSPQ